MKWWQNAILVLAFIIGVLIIILITAIKLAAYAKIAFA